MSYAPLASHGSVTGLGFLGCSAKSDRNPPQSQRNSSSDSVPKPSHLEFAPECTATSETAASKSSADCPAQASKQSVALHRVRQVRVQQGVSVRSMAKRLGIEVRQYKCMEDPTTDLTLSELHVIQQALDVPLVDLLEDRNSMSRPVAERAKLVKVMKTAVAIREAKPSQRIVRLAAMLGEQLVDLMPELQDVSGWPQFGARRGQAAIGRALSEPIDTSHIKLHD